MCLAVPGKVVERCRDMALVDLDGIKLRVNVSLIPEVACGEWLLLHAGAAIAKIDAAEAAQTQSLLRELEALASPRCS